MGMRVLVVEDEDDIADFVTRGLREEGFTVERAADGDAALWALRTFDWDVVLLDWWPAAFSLSNSHSWPMSRNFATTAWRIELLWSRHRRFSHEIAQLLKNGQSTEQEAPVRRPWRRVAIVLRGCLVAAKR
jgi:hypothetical protein